MSNSIRKTITEHGVRALKSLADAGYEIERTDNFLEYCFNISKDSIAKTITIHLLNVCNINELLEMLK